MVQKYENYSDGDKHKINAALMMCSTIDSSNPDHVTGVFKFAIMQGFVRYVDCIALEKSDPYLMKIIAGGLRTSVNGVVLRQKTSNKYSLSEFFVGVLKYYDVILSDYLAFKEAENKILTKKPLCYAIEKAMGLIPARIYVPREFYVS